jgi:3-hydroxyisobutyrate dehydrogenase
VVLGADGALAGMKPGATFVDHTTASADVARELYATAKAMGLSFVDAPVSGGQAGAENGALTVMCGGDQAPFDTAQPVGMAFSKAFTRIGDAGAGQLAKMVNQICIGGLVQGLAEAIAFGQHAGLDMNLVLDVIGKGAAQSWQMDNRGKTMVADQFNFGFAVDWMRKDLGLVLDEARRNGARLPVTALVDQFYADVQRMGGNRWDTSSLIKRLQKTACALFFGVDARLLRLWLGLQAGQFLFRHAFQHAHHALHALHLTHHLGHQLGFTLGGAAQQVNGSALCHHIKCMDGQLLGVHNRGLHTARHQGIVAALAEGGAGHDSQLIDHGPHVFHFGGNLGHHGFVLLGGNFARQQHLAVVGVHTHMAPLGQRIADAGSGLQLNGFVFQLGARRAPVHSHHHTGGGHTAQHQWRAGGQCRQQHR